MKNIWFYAFVLIFISIMPVGIMFETKQIWANTHVDSIEVGDAPRGIVFNPFNDDIYVTNQRSGEVSVIDSSSNTVIDTIPVGSSPVEIVFNPTNDYIYVTNIESDTVSIIKGISSPTEEPRKIVDIIRGILQNPLDVSNSIESSNEIRELLTNENKENYKFVCNALDLLTDIQAENMKELLEC